MKETKIVKLWKNMAGWLLYLNPFFSGIVSSLYTIIDYKKRGEISNKLIKKTVFTIALSVLVYYLIKITVNEILFILITWLIPGTYLVADIYLMMRHDGKY